MSARLEYTSEHHQFRELVHDFVEQTVVPAHEQWEKAGSLDRSLFTEAGKLGLLGFCLQLHGGYGYMREYPVSRAFVDARIQTIYGGTTEIMKTIVAKDLGI
jgi:alkylation response protein AidB-like acyl-CoA dehydrogenase